MSENVAPFHRRLVAALSGVGDRAGVWEWIVVVDGSWDGTSEAVALLAAGDGRARGVRHAPTDVNWFLALSLSGG